MHQERQDEADGDRGRGDGAASLPGGFLPGMAPPATRRRRRPGIRWPADDGAYPRLSAELWTSRQRQAANLHEISYRACYKPQLPRHFIERLTRPGDRVYDPFSGRGTTAVEAALLARRVAANDVNPLSRMLAEPPPDAPGSRRRGQAPGGDPPHRTPRRHRPRHVLPSGHGGRDPWPARLVPGPWGLGCSSTPSTPGSAWWPPTASRATAPASSPSTPCLPTRPSPRTSSGRSTFSGSRPPPTATPGPSS